MESKIRRDLVINGFGSSNGGEFDRVKLNGKGTVNNDLVCTEFDCNGSGVINGNLYTQTAKINGNGKINGKMESQLLTIDGTAKITDNLFVKELKVAGKATIGGKVKSDEIHVRGRLTVEGDCEAEIFLAESQFTIGGLLNAEKINIKLFGECKAKEIGGQTIVIKHKGSLLGFVKSFVPTQLETELMEGDRIEIESTKANVVRGNHVLIGPHCTIDVVEYSGEFLLDKTSTVKEIREI